MTLQKTMKDFELSMDQLTEDFNRVWAALDLPGKDNMTASVISTTLGDLVGLFRDGELVHIITPGNDKSSQKLA